ncbi:MAG: iron-containing alcohol dehydrogenase [Lachnospiraceae bacterium]|nr:iron-containing alcohol dehydrogenase [Lachnospiraceae bacterium]
MDNFIQWTPTEVIFGRGTEQKAGLAVKRHRGTRVLVVYGGGSAVKSGLLSRVRESLDASKVAYAEFGGARANPTLKHAEEGVRLATDFKADFILAVGGGSVIDTAKGIAHGAANPGVSLWDIWTERFTLLKSLPVGAVLTIAAAGSEMSDSAVLTNEDIPWKKGLNTPFNRCAFAILNPELLFTVPPYQLFAGVADIMMHTMERYFIPGIKCELTDEIAEGLLRTVVRNARILLKDSHNYDAMAEILWASSLSHNNLTECGRGRDFSVHKIGMPLSGRYNYTHGATLTAVWSAWARYLYEDAPDRFAKYARNVWGIRKKGLEEAAMAGIYATDDFFREIGMPISLLGLGEEVFGNEEIRLLAQDATVNDTIKLSRIRPLSASDVENIYRMAL